MIFIQDLSDRNFAKKAIAAALEWCNQVRASKGHAPLGNLPKGKRRNSGECPCGKVTGVFVGVYNACALELDSSTVPSFPLPEWVQVFVELFDEGHLPHLDVDALIDNGLPVSQHTVSKY